MRRIRNAMFVVLVLVAVFASGRGVLGGSARARHCSEQPRCSYLYDNVQCNQWPQDGCYLSQDTTEIDQETAQGTCEAWMKCGWAVEAEEEGDCWWCQFELARGSSCQ